MTQPSTPPQQTLDQRRAKHAMHAVDQAKKLPTEKAKKYGGQARKLPMRIVASGLGQALAFLKAKDYAPDLLVALGDWVLGVVKPTDDVNKQLRNSDERLLRAVILSDANFLRQATDEALAYLQWLNRFCEANDLSNETENN